MPESFGAAVEGHHSEGAVLSCGCGLRWWQGPDGDTLLLTFCTAHNSSLVYKQQEAGPLRVISPSSMGKLGPAVVCPRCHHTTRTHPTA